MQGSPQGLSEEGPVRPHAARCGPERPFVGGWSRRELLKPVLDPVWGDRRQEIVFIGTDPMDETALRARLDACLLNANAFTPGAWTQLPDPFPDWQRQAA